MMMETFEKICLIQKDGYYARAAVHCLPEKALAI